ncbi:MAG: hypothetical protein AAF311_10085 [Pseudomonadota bacterium]
MNFASISFLFYFLPFVVAAYFVLRGRDLRNLWLLCVSLLFYSWGEGFGIALLLGSIGVNHLLANAIARGSSRLWLTVGIIERARSCGS